ncbi:unnamed protein product [Phytophthora fragariaefolia]|uniref:Unnamed protein product n=1 Tax=Phytophthora fragariaefolia TaxID=1490495 RepID=A0A9W6Y7E6_9STRA|nr:unnamed protein product [Phytophthora fragariaefolia]
MEHLRKLFALMRKHKRYANLKKCIFGASEIPVLGCLVGKNGVRPDPGKVRVINEWPTPSHVKELRQFLGLATYLCKYVSNYAGKIRPLSQLLKKDAVWDWTAECLLKQGLPEAPILAVADQDRPFHVVCGASDVAIGCALMQHGHEGRVRVVCYQSRQLKPAECNYPVHDKEPLAKKYALATFRVYLLGSRPFVVYTDHASLRTAIKSPHISQRMARWLSFFAEYNFQVEYKPGRLNVVADALSRRPDYAVHKANANCIGVVRTSTPSSSLSDDVRPAYANDADAKQLLNYFAALLTSLVRRWPNTSVPVYTDIVSKAVDFVQRRQAVIRFVQDAIAASVDRQKLTADNNGRCNTNEFEIGSLVLSATQNLAKHGVSDFGASKLGPRFIGPFTVLAKHGNAYTLDIPSSMRLHPTFNVGRLKPFAQYESPSLGDSAPMSA